MSCSWLIQDYSKTFSFLTTFRFCSLLFHIFDMFTTCSQFVHTLLFITCSWLTHCLLFVHDFLFKFFATLWIYLNYFTYTTYFTSFTSLNSSASLEMLYFIYLTWTTHLIQNTSFEFLQVRAELGTAQPWHVFPFLSIFPAEGFFSS